MALGARPGVKTPVFQQAPNGLAAQTGAICRGAERGAQLMQKPLADEYAAGYQKYFDLVPEGDYLTVLRNNSLETIAFFEKIPNEKLEYRYSDGKWTIKEVFMHIVDTERVFSYRGLAAARGDASPHYRMDEEMYAGNVDVSPRSLQSLISEFRAVRASTEQLYEHITDDQSKLKCNIVTHRMSARAIGYFLIGHIRHHLNVIKERYL
jgi:uncharacterized damage-inducible protein DinB